MASKEAQPDQEDFKKGMGLGQGLGQGFGPGEGELQTHMSNNSDQNLIQRLAKMQPTLFQKITIIAASMDPEKQPNLAKMYTEATMKIRQCGWNLPDRSLTEKSFRRNRIKHRPCYNCKKDVHWTEIAAIRAFPWEKMPEFELKLANQKKITSRKDRKSVV